MIRDLEIEALRQIAQIFETLTAEERARVLKWLNAKYCSDVMRALKR